jgi:hypothetical protein
MLVRCALYPPLPAALVNRRVSLSFRFSVLDLSLLIGPYRFILRA